MDRPLPVIFPLTMIAVWLAGMVSIKLYVAPWIVSQYGWVGVVVTVLACLAAGKQLER